MKKIILLVGLTLVLGVAKTQFITDKVTKENKFFLKGSNIFFASYDENYFNDSLISGYTIKDIRGMVIANVLFKVGKLNTDADNSNLLGYTEIIFTKSFLRSQQLGFICEDALAGVFEELLYDSVSANLASKKFTYKYELDYEKIEKFALKNGVICSDKLESFYNPVEDYYNLIAFFKTTKNCSKKRPTNTMKKVIEPSKKYIPKKLY